MAKSTTRSVTGKSATTGAKTAAAKTSSATPAKAVATKMAAAKKLSSAVKAASEAPAPADLPKIASEGVAETLDLGRDAGDGPDANVMKKKELIDAVVARSGVKKRDAKPAIEAALAILGEALVEGRVLNLPPFGKAKVQNSKELHDATVLNVRMRRKTSMGDENESDTDSDDDAENGDTGLAKPAD